MFKIIGADQKEYGPISAEQIRQWIIDGRLNAQTRAQRDGGEWQTLSAFDEFADVLRPAAAGTTPPPPGSAPAPMAMPGGPGSRDAALQALKGPAIALIVTSSIGVALCLFAAVRAFVGIHPTLPPNFPEQWRHIIENTGGFPDLLGVALNGFVLIGALKMLRGQSRSLAMAACIVAMLPCSCCCVFGLPFGIWGLVVLNKPEVKSQFS
jgi:GYF domain 2